MYHDLVLYDDKHVWKLLTSMTIGAIFENSWLIKTHCLLSGTLCDTFQVRHCSYLWYRRVVLCLMKCDLICLGLMYDTFRTVLYSSAMRYYIESSDPKLKFMSGNEGRINGRNFHYNFYSFFSFNLLLNYSHIEFLLTNELLFYFFLFFFIKSIFHQICIRILCHSFLDSSFKCSLPFQLLSSL